MAGEKSYSKLRAPLKELRKAADDRLADSEVLFEGRRYPSAVAMGIYSLEIYLKVKICERLDLDFLPQLFEIHDLDSLLVLSGLKRKLGKEKVHHEANTNWNFVIEYSNKIEQYRYESRPDWTEQWARAMMESLFNRPNGVIPWLKERD